MILMNLANGFLQDFQPFSLLMLFIGLLVGMAVSIMPGLGLVICHKPVPCGSATQRVEDSTGVHLSPVSEELNVTDVLNKVTTGQADAGLVYVTDARSAGSKATTVNFPEAAGAVNVYPVAVLKKAPQPTLAQKFVAMVTGDPGQNILAQSGFAKP